MRNFLLASTTLQYIIYVAIGLAAFILMCAIIRLIHWLVTKNKNYDDEEYDSENMSLSAAPKRESPPPPPEVVAPNFGGETQSREIIIKITNNNKEGSKASIDTTKSKLKTGDNLAKSLTRQDIFDRIEFMRRDPAQYDVLSYYKDKDEAKNHLYDFMICGERAFCFVESDETEKIDLEEKKLCNLKSIGFRLSNKDAEKYEDLKLIGLDNIKDFYLLDIENGLSINKKQIYELMDASYSYTGDSFYSNKEFDDEGEHKKGEKEIRKINEKAI